MKKLLYAIVVIGVLGAAYGYYQWNRPVSSNEGKKADMTISAADLEAAYTSNENEANAKYNDKLVAVSGAVNKIEQAGGKTSIYLSTNNPIVSVICEMEVNASLGNIKEGDNVQIQGKPTGILTDVVLVQCVLIQ